MAKFSKGLARPMCRGCGMRPAGSADGFCSSQCAVVRQLVPLNELRETDEGEDTKYARQYIGLSATHSANLQNSA